MARHKGQHRPQGGGCLITLAFMLGVIIFGRMSLPGLPNPYSNDRCPIDSPPITIRLAIFLAFPEPWLYPKAEALSLSESNYVADEIVDNDYGHMQVNIYHQAPLMEEMGVTPDDLLNPFTNARVARKIYERNQRTFNPWYGPKRCGFNLN